MPIALQAATAGDVDDLVSLRQAVNDHLVTQFGRGYWVSGVTRKGVLFSMKRATVFIARGPDKLIARLALSTIKPWAIDKKYFSPSKRPLYLTAMAVAPTRQREGIGRQCLTEATRIAREWPGDAIRLDAYDAAAGAGDFYRKCGFCEVGRAAYRGVPLIYFELLV
jgi:ribosomal protein S18 acetylase RimI-like enzyme